MKIENIRYILLDLDGTIIDSVEGITRSAAYALQAFGIEVTDLSTLHCFIGPPLRDSFMDFYRMSEEEAEKAVAKYRERYREKGIYENTLYEGIEKFLEEMHGAGYKLILATSKPEPFARKILAYFNLDRWFTFIGGCGLDGSRHSKADVIEYVLAENGITGPEGVVMVGDRKHDVVGAEVFGIPTIGVLYGYGSEEELRTAGASWLARDVDELKQLLL